MGWGGIIGGLGAPVLGVEFTGFMGITMLAVGENHGVARNSESWGSGKAIFSSGQG